MTPMQWVANELDIESQARAVARRPLHDVAKGLGISESSLTYYLNNGYPAPERVRWYCKHSYHINFDYLLTALRSVRSERGRYANRVKDQAEDI